MQLQTLVQPPIRSACYIVRPGVQTSHFDIVKCLVKAGANLSASNHFGGTCLINSVQSPTLVALLLETKNIEVNAQDIQRKTALHYAVQARTYKLEDYYRDFIITWRVRQ